jgi:UDP-N-acetylmuramoyl-tripeptide--D-alanyl-D-alanine ligase
VLNADDPRVARMAGRAPGRVVLYGEHEAADVRATEVELRGTEGLALTISYQGHGERVHVPLVGRHFVSAVLAAAACGLVEGCAWEDVRAGLSAEINSQRLRPRRLSNGVTLLDDTYNASPDASKAALDVLAALPGRRVAVLGDMFELGDYAEVGHAEVGRYVPGRADLLVTVGELGAVIARAAAEAGLPAAGVHSFGGNDEAAAFLGARLQPGDYVLIKGSHGMHMDSLVRALMDDEDRKTKNEEL